MTPPHDAEEEATLSEMADRERLTSIAADDPSPLRLRNSRAGTP
jgi:hypothetical protein